MELISPVCRFADIDDYKDQLITAWRVLDENFEIETNHNCGTHIHVSPVESGEGGGKFTVHQATTMAKAIVYYERCLDSLMGPERLANFFCKSNRHNVQLREKDIKEVFEEIETIANNAAENTVFGNYVFMKLLFDLVCSQAKVEENRYRGGDYFRWNLKHLQRNKIGTIEFRQPPASDSWSHAYQWVVLLKAYVSGAMIEEYDLDNQPEPSMETFKKFIFKGAKASGIEEYSNQDNYLRQSFEKAVKLPEPEFDLMPLDPVRLDEPAKAAMNKLNELLNNKREKLQNDHPDKIITLDYVKERYGYC